MKLRQSASISDNFESLFDEHWASIYRLLVRMVIDPAEAEDLALETFYRLHKYRPAFGEQVNVGGWLHKVAVNLGLQSIRSFKRRQQYERTAGQNALEVASPDQPAEIFSQQEDQHRVRTALANMNPRQAELLVLRHSGLAYKEIAAALRLSPTSIGPLLLRAEQEFEEYYRALTKEAE
jgi:RNA polymerase sigma-70 factor (ECF subfamily)